MTSASSTLVGRHVLHRCGQAVSHLVEAGLVPRPHVQGSEQEVREWWLVAPELGERLSAAGLPV
jgi:hypothetical protein